jgi:cyclopropane fatty-acyl-phospholipid synthase-like methyltransferase
MPDSYFDDLYDDGRDPWHLSERWYEKRKYAITMAMLPQPTYRHAFEPGCSVGVLTEQLTTRCAHVTATDIVSAALRETERRLIAAGRYQQVTLRNASLDAGWPAFDFDLIVLSEIAYYFSADALRALLDIEVPKLAPDTTVVAAHWRHPVSGYPLDGHRANQIIAATTGLHQLARYADADVVIDVLDTAAGISVAARTQVPGAA